MTLTPRFSATPMICLRPMAQFSMPCSSLTVTPALSVRLPEKTITLGRPASATALMRSVMDATYLAWFAIRLKPTGMVVVPVASAQVSPSFWTVGQSLGSRSSTDSMPNSFTALANSSSGILPKHHLQTE